MEKLILNDMLPAVVAFCRTSTHVGITRLFPLFSAYLCIYVDEDTIPDLLMNWSVFSVAISTALLPNQLFRNSVAGVIIGLSIMCCMKPDNLLLSVQMRLCNDILCVKWDVQLCLVTYIHTYVKSIYIAH